MCPKVIDGRMLNVVTVQIEVKVLHSCLFMLFFSLLTMGGHMSLVFKMELISELLIRELLDSSQPRTYTHAHTNRDYRHLHLSDFPVCVYNASAADLFPCVRMCLLVSLSVSPAV